VTGGLVGVEFGAPKAGALSADDLAIERRTKRSELCEFLAEFSMT